MNTRRIVQAGASLILAGVITAGAGFQQGWFNKDSSSIEAVGEVKGSVASVSLPVETVGASELGMFDNLGTSWPGEIISSGDIEVQPQRDGTVVGWKVKIGQRVKQGQVLARLSAPPSTPELTQTLAEQAQSLARAKAQATATANFTQKNIQQLSTLRDALEKNLNSTGTAATGAGNAEKASALASAKIALEQTQTLVQVKQQNARNIIEQILKRQVLKFASAFDPQYFRYGSVRRGLGDLDETNKTRYEELVYKLVAELKKSDMVSLAETAQKYLQTAVQLANTSILVNGITQEDLDNLRTMANDDQVDFLSALKDYQEAKSELAARDADYKAKEVEYQTRDTDYKLSQLGQEKDYAEKKKEIEEKIAELEKELELAQAEVKGAEAAYRTIAGALTGGLSITAPRAGVVSTILKKNGDFVSPGTAVASINSGNNKDQLVRFRIPGNIIPPQAGSTLTVIRPGFPKDGKQIKLVGIGLSLDGNGAYLADADFVEPVDWPVHASVRVLAAANGNAEIAASLEAVWWDESGHANVWLVTEEARIRPQEVTTGRTIGDKIEVLEGLQQGDKYIARATTELKIGMEVNQTVLHSDTKAEVTPAGDGHGHTHDE
jgi:multidrug efflux pump subunit AcrA (membrane-fusion protein)